MPDLDGRPAEGQQRQDQELTAGDAISEATTPMAKPVTMPAPRAPGWAPSKRRSTGSPSLGGKGVHRSGGTCRRPDLAACCPYGASLPSGAGEWTLTVVASCGCVSGNRMQDRFAGRGRVRLPGTERPVVRGPRWRGPLATGERSLRAGEERGPASSPRSPVSARAGRSVHPHAAPADIAHGSRRWSSPSVPDACECRA